MENKKNYVDGVDVSGCKYCDDGTCCDKDVMSLSCENTDCIYKQLKRLEQENKELRQIRNDTPDIQQPYVIMYRNLKKELHNLQAENERLKEENKKLKEPSLIVPMPKQTGVPIEDYEKLYKALQEIRKLIKKLDLSLGCAYGDYDCDNCSDINEKTVCKIKLQNIIIDKINSVIGAE